MYPRHNPLLQAKRLLEPDLRQKQRLQWAPMPHLQYWPVSQPLQKERGFNQSGHKKNDHYVHAHPNNANGKKAEMLKYLFKIHLHANRSHQNIDKHGSPPRGSYPSSFRAGVNDKATPSVVAMTTSQKNLIQSLTILRMPAMLHLPLVRA